MSDLIFYTWYHFQITSPKFLAVNSNRLVAACDINNHILIWHQDQDSDQIQLSKGEIRTYFQINEGVEQLLWIEGTDKLLVKTPQEIQIWDIYDLTKTFERSETRQIMFATSIETSTIIIFADASILVIRENRIRVIDASTSIFEPTSDGIFAFPSMYSEKEGLIQGEQLSPSRDERRVRNNFNSKFNTDINQLFILGEGIPDNNLRIPKSYAYHFKNSKQVVITTLGDHYYKVASADTVIIVDQKGEKALNLPTAKAFLFSLEDTGHIYAYYHNNYYRIEDTGSTIISTHVKDKIQHQSIRLRKVPPHLYLDPNVDLQYARCNFEEGMLWYPTGDHDHIFLDLHRRDGVIFPKTGRFRHSYILVASNKHYVLEWRRGESYPSGKLLYYDLLEPERDPIILYDEDIETKQLSPSEFLNGKIDDNINFPLIIPSCNIIDLHAYDGELKMKQSLSSSQYFFLVDKWSRSDQYCNLTFDKQNPEDISFVKYGEISLELEDRKIDIENVGPMYCISPKENYLAYHSSDGKLYIIDLQNQYLLPVYSSSAEFPLTIRFYNSNSTNYLLYIDFDLRETSLLSHPYNENKENLNSLFPYVRVRVINITKRTQLRKSIRFPIKLISTTWEVEYDETNRKISCKFPSYTDPEQHFVCDFDLNEEKFHISNQSEHYRYWQNYTYNSPFNKWDKGEQFPMVEHPEIKREYMMRPALVYDHALVRKSDQLVLSASPENSRVIPQKSTSHLYSLENTRKLHVPFYYSETLKPIWIESEMAQHVSAPSHIDLSRVEELPQQYFIKYQQSRGNEGHQSKINEIITTILDNNELHNESGISYHSPNLEGYQEKLSSIQKELANLSNSE